MEQASPLWRQLNATAAVVLAVRSGSSGTAAIGAVSKELRSAVQSLAFHAWRNWGRAQALRAKLASKTPPASADALLCLALALAWQEVDAPYDAFTLVNQTVEAAKRSPDTKAHANFINACLRRFLRERDALIAATDGDPVARWNHPRWWIKRLQADHPQAWQSLLQTANRHPPMTLRVNRRKSDVPNYLQKLTASGIPARATPEGAIVLGQAVGVQKLPDFANGWVSVQDAAAQLAAPLLLAGMEREVPLRILDACAAPGGKTAHLLELCDADLVALEVEPQRTNKILESLTRLGLSAEIKTADASHPAQWWDGRPFDAILLDAPCSASGIVRRHPDIRWLRRETDIAQLAAIQQTLLKSLWPLVKPGGRLLYCTCSVFRAEGSEQLEAFLSNNTDALLLPSPGHIIAQKPINGDAVSDNQPCDYDGFYYGLLQKRTV